MVFRYCVGLVRTSQNLDGCQINDCKTAIGFAVGGNLGVLFIGNSFELEMCKVDPKSMQTYCTAWKN